MTLLSTYSGEKFNSPSSSYRSGRSSQNHCFQQKPRLWHRQISQEMTSAEIKVMLHQREHWVLQGYVEISRTPFKTVLGILSENTKNDTFRLMYTEDHSKIYTTY